MNPKLETKMGHQATAGVEAAPGVAQTVKIGHHFEVECWRDGKLIWSDGFHNLVVNEGLNHILDEYYDDRNALSLFIGLTDGTPTPAAGDTMSSHAGWAEVVAYTEGTREAYVAGAASSQSIDNSASKASFSINGTTTVGGAFMSTDSTKSGTSGTLIGVGAFTGGDRSLQSGDTLNVTLTATAAAS